MSTSIGRRCGWSFGLAFWISAATLLGQAKSPPWTVPVEEAKKTNPLPSTQNDLALGKKIYADRCSDCHGESGKGDGPSAADLSRPPTNLRSSAILNQSDGALFWKITSGRRPMPSYRTKLTDEQRWQVVTYIRSWTQKPPNKDSKNK